MKFQRNPKFICYLFSWQRVSHLKTKLLFLRHPYEVLSFNRVIEQWERNIDSYLGPKI